jgi:plasmid stability protein
VQANKAQEGGEIMPSVTVRNVPDEVHRALRVRAAQHGRSAEAEIREILENAVQPEGRVKLGSLLASIGRKINLSDDEFSIFEQSRDTSPAKPVDFE